MGNKKENKLVLTSIGSGGCLAEWSLLSQLNLMGFKNVEVHLADPAYAQESDIKTALLAFFSQFKGAHYEFHFHPSLEEFAKKSIETDILLALDWDIERDGGDEEDSELPLMLVNPEGFSYINKEEPKWKNTAKTQFKTELECEFL